MRVETKDKLSIILHCVVDLSQEGKFVWIVEGTFNVHNQVKGFGWNLP
jgi:hypothetical protein